jgi:hypothetical protein
MLDDQNFEFVAGNDGSIEVDCTDEDGAAYDLSSVDEIEWFLKTSEDVPGYLVKHTMTEGKITVVGSPALGIIKVTIDSTDTSSLHTPQTYFHGIRLTEASNGLTDVARGEITILSKLD